MDLLKNTLFFALCLAFLNIPVLAKSAAKKEGQTKEIYKTRQSYYAAASTRDLDLLARYEARGNTPAIRKMVEAKRLIPLGDEEVTVEQASPLYGTVVKVKTKKTNQEYWMVKEAIVGGEKVVTVNES